jgi:hypothetical protein
MLGDAETEHQKFTMDPRRTPQKFREPSYDQMSDYAGNPRAPAAPAPPCSYRQSADPPSQDVGFVADLDVDLDVVAQRAPLAHVEREPVQAR